MRIYDFKTDRGRHAQSEYRKQPSVYYHVLAGQYPNKLVTASLFFTEDGEAVEIDAISEDRLVNLIQEGV